jgi:hypothetical protein
LNPGENRYEQIPDSMRDKQGLLIISPHPPLLSNEASSEPFALHNTVPAPLFDTNLRLPWDLGPKSTIVSGIL